MPDERLPAARTAVAAAGLDGWLLYDFRGSNPILWELLGTTVHTTRRCFLVLPAQGEPWLLVHQVDAGQVAGLALPRQVYLSRLEMLERLRSVLRPGQRWAMEYSPLGALPMVSRVDAGTLELIRSLGVEVVSSAEVLQLVVARWTPGQVASHLAAARKLGQAMEAAFAFVAENVHRGIGEYHVLQHILERFTALGLRIEDQPVVAVGAHSADPHYTPGPTTSAPIRPGDWLLIDMWAREMGTETIFADITWVAFVGPEPPAPQQAAFAAVRAARDRAVDVLQAAWARGETLQGWQVDREARDLLTAHGYGPYFTHRLGHSLGTTVHALGVNLDDFETHDTRPIIPGVGFTIEPGVYLPEFGVRLEINVFVDADRGPQVTTPVQTEIVRIIPR